VSVFIALLIFCSFLCLYRVGKGPTAPDRTVAIDILGTLIVGFAALFSIITKKDLYMNIGISWALLSFIGTLALAKYLEGRGFDE
jgi:multicomponent Na+:H+ antiporter subunit F